MRFVDHESEAVRGLARESAGGAGDERAAAVALFATVRDAVRYDYRAISLDPAALVASRVLAAGRSFCVGKAVLLAAACRARGIECRLGFADVRNHLAPAHLVRLMGTDVFVFHGYVLMRLGGRWVKATPAFDRSLCTRFGVRPVEFDGVHDALFHEYDARGERHMEYIRERGTFEDLPFERMVEAFRRAYPRIFEGGPLDPDRLDPDGA
jgi:transglutaminase-like putative cysteine protease